MTFRHYPGPLSGGLSRRQILQSSVLVGAGLATGLVGPRRALAQEPRHGGVLNILALGEPPTFDIFTVNSGATLNIVGPCYNSLIMADPMDPARIVGDLAESWDLSEDGTSYTFRLVQNARFHDGVPLTSADVKATFDTARNPPPEVLSIRKQALSAIDTIETPDPYTVVFNLKAPSPALITTLATGWYVVAPKHILDVEKSMKDKVIGSGPFMLKEHVRGVSVELVRNPNYHVPDRPYMDGIKYYLVPDPATRLAYMRTGDVDMYIDVPPADARAIQAEMSGTVNVHSAPNYNGDPFVMNSRRTPFDDIRVRQAIAMSIDHEDALRVIYAGAGVVGGLLPPGKWGLPAEELANIPGYGPDVEANRAAARALLAEAGFPNGFQTTLTARKATATHEARAVYLADTFSKIGVNVNIQLHESAAYLDLMARGDFEIATNILSSVADDPDSLFGDYHTCAGTLNYSGVCNPAIDELFFAQSIEVDPARRLEIVRQMETEQLKQFSMIVLYFKNKYVAVNKRVNNFAMHGEPDNNRRSQDLWLSDA